MHAERFDAMVTFAGCDKSLPGMLMAAARLNLPAVFLYGGTILPGTGPHGEALDVVSVFEAVGARAAGKLTDEELGLIERSACPTVGSCAGMFTANTMASASEALGMALPGSASPPAVDARRDGLAVESGRAVVRLLEARHSPPADPDQGSLRERHRRGHGPRRFHECRSSSTGDSQRSPGGAALWTTSTGSVAGFLTSRT